MSRTQTVVLPAETRRTHYRASWNPRYDVSCRLEAARTYVYHTPERVLHVPPLPDSVLELSPEWHTSSASEPASQSLTEDWVIDPKLGEVPHELHEIHASEKVRTAQLVLRTVPLDRVDEIKKTLKGLGGFRSVLVWWRGPRESGSAFTKKAQATHAEIRALCDQ